jgi:hypothetical protein
MGIRSTDFGALLIEQHVALQSQRIFPDRFPYQDVNSLKTPRVGNPAIALGATATTSAGDTTVNVDRTGLSVSISGDLGAVGVPFQDYDEKGANPIADAGAVYIYKRLSAEAWQFAYKIVAPTMPVSTAANAATYSNRTSVAGVAGFGASVSISNGVLVVGMPTNTTDVFGANPLTNAGAAFVFEVTDTAYVFKQKLVPTGTSARVSGDQFGTSVSIQGDAIAVGAPFQDYDEAGTNLLSDAGAVFLYLKNLSTKNWDQAQKIIGYGNGRNINDYFGNAVSNDGLTMAVGVPGYDYGSTPGLGYVPDAGTVYLYYWDTINKVWQYEAQILSNNRNASARFGDRVAVRGDVLAVSSDIASVGRVRVYRRQAFGVWALDADLAPVNHIFSGSNIGPGNAQFGFSLSLTANKLAVGAPLHQRYSSAAGGNTIAVGNVYVYAYANGVWGTQADLTVYTATPGNVSPSNGDNYGYSVSLTDSVLIVGAPQHSYDGNPGNPNITSNQLSSGAAYIYRFNSTTTNWDFEQKILGWGQDRNNSDRLGTTIAYSNGTLVVSAPLHDYDSNGYNFVDSAGAIYVWTYDGSQWVFQQKITPTGVNSRISSDQFGNSLAIDGDVIIAGSTTHAYNSTGTALLAGAGALWVFKRTNGVWTQTQKITPTVRVAGDAFGTALVLQGTTLAVSAPNNSTDANNTNSIANAGAVYVFEDAGNGYAQVAKLVGQGPGGRTSGDTMGTSLDLRDGLIIAGSSLHSLDLDGANSQSNAGAAWMWQRDNNGAWNFVTKFTGYGQDRNTSDFMGWEIAGNGMDSIAVGVPTHSYDANSRNFVTNSGAVLVYIWDGAKWLFQAKLTSEGNRQTYGRFGKSLAFDGDTLVVGAPGEELPSPNQYGVTDSYWGNGAVYVFARNYGVWSRQARLLPTGTNAAGNNAPRYQSQISSQYSHNRFGWSLSLQGDLLAVGSPWSTWDHTGANPVDFAGAAYVFVRNTATLAWTQEARLSSAMVSSDRGSFDLFGYSVSLRDGVLVVGSPLQDTDQNANNPQTNAGAAYVFRRDPNGASGFVWNGEQKLVGWGQDRVVSDKLGSAMAGFGGTLAVGSPFHSYDSNGSNYLVSAGAVYMWVFQNNGWVFQQKVVASGVANARAANANFGAAVGVYGDTMIVGAPAYPYFTDGTKHTNQLGAAWVFTRTDGVWSFQSIIQHQLYTKTEALNGNYALEFGSAVAINRDTLAVGDQRNVNNLVGTKTASSFGGKVSVFVRSGTTWSHQQTMLATNGPRTSEYFGRSLDLQDGVLVVGSPFTNTNNDDLANSSTTNYGSQGGMWVYTRSGTVWTQIQKITPPQERNPNDQLGSYLVSDNNTLVVSAVGNQSDMNEVDTRYQAGAVYTYGFANGAWHFESKLTPSGLNAREDNQQFGFSMALSGDTLVVGSLNSTYDASGANALSQAGAAWVFRSVAGTTPRRTRKRMLFASTGAAQQFQVPANITSLNVGLWGAAGGSNAAGNALGGSGGFTFAQVPVTPGETLNLIVGKGGRAGVGANGAGSGGGRTELLRNTSTLAVAGAGGGSTFDVYYAGTGSEVGLLGGNGGGPRGHAGMDVSINAGGGQGGTSTVGGAGGYTSGTYKGGDGAAKQGGNGYAGTGATVILGGYPNGGNATYGSVGSAVWACAGGGDGWYGGGAGSSASAAGLPATQGGSAAGGGSSYLAPGVTGYFVTSADYYGPEVKRLLTVATPTAAAAVATAVQNSAGGDGAILIEWDEIYYPRTWTQEARITPTGTNARTANDQFGYSVAIDGNTMAITAPGQDYDSAGTNSVANTGAVYVFDRDPSTRAWTQTTKLVGFGVNGRNSGDQLGMSLALSGDLLAAGSPAHSYDETGTALANGAGATFTYRRTNGTWVPLTKVVGWGRDITNGDHAGYAVSGDGIYVAVGALDYSYDGDRTNYFQSAGSVYIWNWNGTNWTLEQQIYAPAAMRNSAANFGFALDMVGDTLMVGAPGTTTNAITTGAAFVFRRTNSVAGAPWQLENAFAPDTTDTLGSTSRFGSSVCFYKETAAIGAPGPAGASFTGGSVFVYDRTDATWARRVRLAPDAYTNNSDQFGTSVSMYDDMMVVGSALHDGDQDNRNFVTDAGAAYVFLRSNGTWTQSQKLVAWGQDRNANDQLGLSMATSNTTLVVGAPGHSYDDQGNLYVPNAGAAYVWVWEGNPAAWRLQQKLTPTGTNARGSGDRFGTAVAISGDLIVVGASAHTADAAGATPLTGAGAVWVFRRNPGPVGSNVWTQQAKITPTGTNARITNDAFGTAIACEEGTGSIVVSSPNNAYDDAGANNVSQAGAVFYFVYDSTNGWVQKQKVVAQGINRGTTGNANARVAADRFGTSLDIRQGFLVVGTPSHDFDQNGRNVLTDAGAVFLFALNNGTGLWEQKQKLVGWGQDRVGNDQYGFAVAGDGNYLAVGAPNHSYDNRSDFYVPAAGAVWIWSYSDGKWNFLQKITAQDGITTAHRSANDQFGYSLSMSSGYLAVGAPFQDYDAAGGALVADAGAVYLFKLVNSIWTRMAKVTGQGTNGRIANDQFGFAVSLDADTLAVGAPLQDWDETGANTMADAGAVYVFRKDDSEAWNLERRLTAAGTGQRAPGDQFGFTLAVKADLLVVGSPFNDTDFSGANAVADTGAAYVYRRTGTTWAFEDKVVLTALERRAGDAAATSIASDATWLVIGAPGHGFDRNNRSFITNSGAAYVFKWNNGWQYHSKLAPTGTNARNSNDRFGSAVAVWNGYIAVSAPNHAYDELGANPVAGAGAVWLFKNGTGDFWYQDRKYVVNGTSASSYVRREDGGYVLLEAGNALSPELPSGGSSARASGDQFGYSLAMTNTFLAIGAPYHDLDVNNTNVAANAGAVFMYSYGTDWTFDAKVTPTGTNARGNNDNFGTSVSIDGVMMLAGAPGHSYDADGNNLLASAGAAWLFEKNGLAWNQISKIVAPQQDRAAGDHYGTRSVASGTALVVSAPDHTLDPQSQASVTGAGALYAYDKRTTVGRSIFLSLNGTTDSADISTVMPALTNGHTIAGWFRFRASEIGSATPQTLWSMWAPGSPPVQQHQLQWTQQGLVMRNSVSTTTVPVQIPVADGNWHHIAVTFTSGGLTSVYVDGIICTTMQNTFSAVAPRSTWGLLLGGATATGASLSSYTVNNFFSGDMSDVAVWNTALGKVVIGQYVRGELTDPATLSPGNLYGLWIKN